MIFQDAIVRFDWSQDMQGMILSSFYIGSFITHIPGGLLAEKIGGKYVFGGALFFSSVCSLITPMAVNLFGATALIVLRVVMGLFQGGFLPAVMTIFAAWVPASERGTLGSIVSCGGPVSLYFILFL